jgi:hypothetical protein
MRTGIPLRVSGHECSPSQSRVAAGRSRSGPGSGIGRNCGQVGLDAYAELKTVVVHKDPAVS